ncbi:hypothetical protein FF80_03354 [Devosia sp. LC5]|uniref:hypothetical protein n=1 Tax=Devosia sp. LC5 TaxID=1502724 RepID=UPI0004E40948|nr:hypothetical protein [Devosia sp. LC5]KFC62787.1 hypothetical protein FF80_03354 [Devosia sp. LC5]
MAIDIDQSHYNTGTATVAETDTIVTFQGAGTLGTEFRKGDQFGTHVGMPTRIAEIGPAIGLSASQILLAYPWLGPSQTEAPYEIQRVPFDLGYQQAINELLELLGGGILPGLAGLDGTGGDKGITLTGAGTAATFAQMAWARAMQGLVGAADKFPYLDSADTAALADLTETARTLLANADASGMQDTLGFSTFFKSLVDDATAGDVLTSLGFSTFFKSLVDDATAGDVLTSLGFSEFVKSLVDDANGSAVRSSIGAIAIEDTGRRLLQRFGPAELAGVSGITLTLPPEYAFFEIKIAGLYSDAGGTYSAYFGDDAQIYFGANEYQNEVLQTSNSTVISASFLASRLDVAIMASALGEFNADFSIYPGAVAGGRRPSLRHVSYQTPDRVDHFLGTRHGSLLPSIGRATRFQILFGGTLGSVGNISFWGVL